MEEVVDRHDERIPVTTAYGMSSDLDCDGQVIAVGAHISLSEKTSAPIAIHGTFPIYRRLD